MQHFLASTTCARGEPVSPELIPEAAPGRRHRVEQFGARVCSCCRNACVPGPTLRSPMFESSCNADNLDSVSIFDGELEDLVPGRRDVSSDIENLHLSEAVVQTCSAVCIALVNCGDRDTSQFFASLRLQRVGSETENRGV